MVLSQPRACLVIIRVYQPPAYSSPLWKEETSKRGRTDTSSMLSLSHMYGQFGVVPFVIPNSEEIFSLRRTFLFPTRPTIPYTQKTVGAILHRSPHVPPISAAPSLHVL